MALLYDILLHHEPEAHDEHEAYSKSSLENVYFLYFYSNHRSLEFMHEKEEKKRLEQRIAMLMYVSV